MQSIRPDAAVAASSRSCALGPADLEKFEPAARALLDDERVDSCGRLALVLEFWSAEAADATRLALRAGLRTASDGLELHSIPVLAIRATPVELAHLLREHGRDIIRVHADVLLRPVEEV